MTDAPSGARPPRLQATHLPEPDFLAIVKHSDGWALRRGDRGPNLLTAGDKEAIIEAGERIARAFGLSLFVDDAPRTFSPGRSPAAAKPEPE